MRFVRTISICIMLAGMLVYSPLEAQAQTRGRVATSAPIAKNLIHGELLGSGGLYSLNYERRFAQRWTARIGFSAYNGEPEVFEDDYVTLVLVPVMVNTLLPGGTHNLELGAGPVLGYASARSDDFGSLSGIGIANISANIAYRYQPTSGGFSFRAGILPNYSGDSINVWPSLSVGYTF